MTWLTSRSSTDRCLSPTAAIYLLSLDIDDLDLTGWNCSYCTRSRSHLQFNTFLHFINFFSHQTVLSSSPQHSQTASYAYSSTDAETLVHAFISSSLAVNNALFFLVFLILFWISSSTFKILLQGFLPFQKRSSYIILVLCSLHWLPVTYRIQYQILLITFKALHNISDTLHPYSPLHSPRSSRIVLLLYPTLNCQHLEAGHSVLRSLNYCIFFLRISNISDFETKLFNEWFQLIYLRFCVYFNFFIFI